MKTRFVLTFALSLLLLVSSACSITLVRKPPVPCGGCTPLYIMQMDTCKANGGQVKTETKSMGSWEAIAQWECICKNGSSFFGEHLACNQWSTPAP